VTLGATVEVDGAATGIGEALMGEATRVDGEATGVG